jgi:tRNA-binding protein
VTGSVSAAKRLPCFGESCSISETAVSPLDAFGLLDLRVGRVLRAEPNERAHKPSYKLWIDFGPLGEKSSNAQLRALYRVDDLVGRLVVAAVNLGARNIAGFKSEVLVLGVPSAAGDVVLLGVERDVPLGGRVY